MIAGERDGGKRPGLSPASKLFGTVIRVLYRYLNVLLRGSFITA
jgi:hypothetical protein